MLAIDETLLVASLEAAERIALAQRAVDDARAGFQRSVRALYVGGASMREIAERLSISHQRVHQLIDVPSGDADWGRSGATTARRTWRRGRAGRPVPVCTFCGRDQAEVPRIIAGPGGIAICSDCATLAHGLLAGDAPGRQAGDAPGRQAENTYVLVTVQAGAGSCGFCGKRTGFSDPLAGGRVLDLVVSPGTAGTVCAECLDLCLEIIADMAAP